MRTWAWLAVLAAWLCMAAGKQKVCIIGAGVAGASCAYRLSQAAKTAMDVVVLERNDRVGGRLLSIEVQGQRVNVGGDAWMSANEQLMDLMHTLPIPVSSGGDYSGNGKTAIFDGKQLFPSSKFEPVTELKVAAELELAKFRLHKNYEANARQPFATIDEYARVGVSNYLTQTAAAWAEGAGLSSFFRRFQWEPLTRTIYDQDLGMTLFASLVSLLSTERSYAARDGNDAIVKLLLEKSGASVRLNSAVADIQSQTLVDVNGNAIVSGCNHIVLAAPIEMAGGSLAQRLGLKLARNYHHWWVSIVGAARFNASYFGSASPVPDSILTLGNSTVPWTTCAVIAKGNVTNIYKCFSNSDISSLIKSRLFEGVQDSHVHYFGHTFPQMLPGNSFQPVVLDGGILYTGALESVAVAMESAIISGYNAARIILQKQ